MYKSRPKETQIMLDLMAQWVAKIMPDN